MKYYIVALFDDSSYEFIAPVQKTVSKKLKANRNSPAPYIALEVVDNPNIEKLTSVIEKVLNPYKKFKIELSSEISISEDLKTVNLGISYRGYIKKIERSLKDTLKSSWQNNKDNYIIKISSEKENSIWQIFSVYKIATTSDYLQTTFSDNEFESFISLIKGRSSYNFETNVTNEDLNYIIDDIIDNYEFSNEEDYDL